MNNHGKTEEQEYIDLYNKGYGLYQFSPELAELIISTEGKIAKIEAFKAGAERAIQDQDKAKLPLWLKLDRFKSNNKEVSKVREKDIEPDKD